MRLAVSSRAGEALAAGRIAAGVAAWLAPNLSARLMGMQPSASATLGLRLFGARDVALGVAYLKADQKVREKLLTLGMAVDGGDALAALAAGRRGGIRRFNSLLIAASALAAVLTANEVRQG